MNTKHAADEQIELTGKPSLRLVTVTWQAELLAEVAAVRSELDHCTGELRRLQDRLQRRPVRRDAKAILRECADVLHDAADQLVAALA